MVLTDDDLRELIESVWAPSVGLPVYEGAPAPDDAFEHAASLRFFGGWNGHVYIDSSDGFARALASVMFGLPESDVTAEDERDALGEMANVLGGNVKTFVPDEVDLELPVTGPHSERTQQGSPIAVSNVSFAERPVRVTVCED